MPSAPLAAGVLPARRGIPKCPTGIRGLDEITLGGLPRGRPTLVSGGPGCGKTLFGLEFLLRGASEFGEPGVCITFEERPDELEANVRSLGFSLDDLIERGLLAIDHVRVERAEIDETGEYDLEALFIRLAHAVDSVGATRIVLDTIESLFSGLTNHGILRAELRRLFRWCKDRGLTAVITCERGEGGLSRHGIEEYVSDCVIVLDHRVADEISTRRIRVVKYRGSAHGADEFPFLIDENGFSVLPVTSLRLEHEAPLERVSTGIRDLDELLEGGGLYRGSTALVSGTAGTGKTTIAANFARAAAERGDRCLYITFEESPRQLIRNMRSTGVDLEPWREAGLLQIHAARPSAYGLELHLATLHRLIDDLDPAVVVIDPISNLLGAGSAAAAESFLWRIVDFLKGRGITALCTSLTAADSDVERSEAAISSLIDTWVLLRDASGDAERRRLLYVLKSRGMGHSRRMHEMTLSSRGIELGPTLADLAAPAGRTGGNGKPERDGGKRKAAKKRAGRA